MTQPFSDIEERLAEREDQLSPFAAKSASAQRDTEEAPSIVRTQFQRDRDRIIHSKSFRRLKHKTQVFVAPTGDHFVTRLTHTLEVAQIARTIARALNLNEDLTEAIGLGHDLGHTPFGHAGESAMAELLPEGFRHNEQSLRVVEKLENGGQGLNLTREVREGILKHSKTRESILAEGWGTARTLEGQIVKIADSVAYLNHDIADAIRAGLLREEDLPASTHSLLGSTHAARINTLVLDIIATSWAASGQTANANGAPPTIRMSEGAAGAANELREYMFQNVYEWEGQQAEASRARRVVQFLFEHYSAHPEDLPGDFASPEDPLVRRVADYIAGMTDLFALRAAHGLGLTLADAPSRW